MLVFFTNNQDSIPDNLIFQCHWDNIHIFNGIDTLLRCNIIEAYNYSVKKQSKAVVKMFVMCHYR